MIKEKNFSLHASFLPDLEKSTSDSDGRIAITGIAATNSFDQAGEVVFIRGMDISPLQTGVLNYDHNAKKDPSAVLGEVTRAWKEPNDQNPERVMVEGFLYKDLDAVQSIVSLVSAMKKSGSTKRLGMSIEGKILVRENNRILKSMAHSVALTPLPVNKDCVVLECGEDMLKSIHDQNFCKSMNTDHCDVKDCCIDCGCGGSCGGECSCKDKKVEKALTAGYGVDPASMHGGEVLKPESLEGADLTCPSCKSKLKHKKGSLHVISTKMAGPAPTNFSKSMDDWNKAFEYVKEKRPNWSDTMVYRVINLHNLKVEGKVKF